MKTSRALASPVTVDRHTAMYSVTQWKKLSNHERNVILQKLKLPYESDRNQYFTGTRQPRETPCTMDDVLKAVNAALAESGEPPERV